MFKSMRGFMVSPVSDSTYFRFVDFEGQNFLSRTSTFALFGDCIIQFCVSNNDFVSLLLTLLTSFCF